MAEESEGSGFGHSFTDLMTSLMVIFILLLVATLNNAHVGVTNTRSALMEKLEEALKDVQGVTVTEDPKDPSVLILDIPQKLSGFVRGSSTIPAPGIVFLGQFIPRFAQVICSPEFKSSIGSVVVEGHADQVGSDVKNIGLSQNRATAVAVRSLQEIGGTEQSAERRCFESVLSVAGRGKMDTDLISRSAGFPSTQVSAAERSVIFRIRIRSSAKAAFKQKIRSAANGRPQG